MSELIILPHQQQCRGCGKESKPSRECAQVAYDGGTVVGPTQARIQSQRSAQRKPEYRQILVLKAMRLQMSVDEGIDLLHDRWMRDDDLKRRQLRG